METYAQEREAEFKCKVPEKRACEVAWQLANPPSRSLTEQRQRTRCQIVRAGSCGQPKEHRHKQSMRSLCIGPISRNELGALSRRAVWGEERASEFATCAAGSRRSADLCRTFSALWSSFRVDRAGQHRHPRKPILQCQPRWRGPRVPLSGGPGGRDCFS